MTYDGLTIIIPILIYLLLAQYGILMQSAII